MDFTPHSPPLDPALLAAFRREGAAIIAQERGLTPGCRLRLAQAARNAGLLEEQVEEAIRSLSAAAPAAPPSVAAERFRERLRKDLSVKSRPILGPTTEAKILAAAQRKFGLNAALALQVLGEVAAELGLTRITASDALSSLTTQIDQAAGASTWLAREAWDRLRSAGAKWGLELEVIDSLIEERLTANRADDRRRQFWIKATLLGTGGAVLAAGVLLVGLGIARVRTSESARSTSSSASPDRSANEPLATTPHWWDVPLSVDMAAARGRKSAPADVLEKLGSLAGEDRAAAYEQLMSHARMSDKPDVFSDIQRIVVGCLALETDAAAAGRLQAAVAALFPDASGGLPDDDEAIAYSLWGAEAIGKAFNRAGITDERQQKLAQVLRDAIGGESLTMPDKEQRQRLIRQRTILAWYAQLAAGAKEPAAVAAIYPALSERATLILDEDEYLDAEASLLVAALPAAGEDWLIYQRAIGRIISSPDPQLPLRLVDVLRRATDKSLINYLTRLLVVRSGAEPRTSARKDVVLAVRKALTGDRSDLAIADRWFVLEAEVAEALEISNSSSQEQVLAQIVGLAHLTTLAIALTQGEAGLATFDARIDQPPTLEPLDNGPDARSVADAARKTPSKAQQRELAACLEDLSKNNPANKPAREAAWRRLAALAKDMEDISPAAAAQIAAQALAPSELSDFAKRLPTLAQLRHWEHFRLAIGDKLGTAAFPLALQRELVGALTSQEIRTDAGEADLRRLLMTSVLSELSRRGRASAADELVDAADAQLRDLYFERARLLGAGTSKIAMSQSPAQLAEQCLARIAQDIPAVPANRLNIDHQLVAAKHLAAGNDIRHFALVQGLLVAASSRQIAARQPSRARVARQLLASSQEPIPNDVLTQLRDQESALLQLWMLNAPEA